MGVQLPPFAPLALKNLLLIIVILLAPVSYWRALQPESGGDFRIYCAALRLTDQGRDPHDVASLEKEGAPFGLPLTNPATVLPLLRPVCAREGYASVWILLVGATIVAVGLLDRHADWLLLSALVAGGLDAVTWMLRTGNIAVLELLLTGIAFAALMRRRDRTFGLGVGAAAFLKLTPAVLAAVPFAYRAPSAGLGAAAVALLTFVGLHALTLLVMPHAFIYYWSHMASGFGGFLGAEAIYGGITHPSLFSLLSDWTSSITGRRLFAVPLFVAIAGMVAIDLVCVTRRLSTAQDGSIVMPLWALALLALMPRVKPYAFGLCLVPLYFAGKTLSSRRQIGLIAACCVLPLAASIMAARPASARIFGYGQLFALLIGYFVVRISAARPAASARSDILQGHRPEGTS
jgi:hypothetical protein